MELHQISCVRATWFTTAAKKGHVRHRWYRLWDARSGSTNYWKI